MKSLPTQIGDLRVGDEILYWGTIMKITEIHGWNTRGLRITGTRWMQREDLTWTLHTQTLELGKFGVSTGADTEIIVANRS